jgi:hypothetical protein
MHAITDRISQLNKSTFLTLFAMAMDYISIQALSVPCERVFSSSAKSDTKHHNCMSPILMEALQMLKFTLKKEHLNFMLVWMIDQKDLYTDSPDSNLLSQLKRCEDNPNDLNDLQDKIMQYMDKYEAEE